MSSATPGPPRPAAGIPARGLDVLMLSLHGLIRGQAPELGRDPDTGGQVTYVLELARTLVLDPKVILLDAAQRRGVPVISSMGAALRTDPTQVRVGLLQDVHTCPLAARIRVQGVGGLMPRTRRSVLTTSASGWIATPSWPLSWVNAWTVWSSCATGPRRSVALRAPRRKPAARRAEYWRPPNCPSPWRSHTGRTIHPG